MSVKAIWHVEMNVSVAFFIHLFPFLDIIGSPIGGDEPGTQEMNRLHLILPFHHNQHIHVTIHTEKVSLSRPQDRRTNHERSLRMSLASFVLFPVSAPEISPRLRIHRPTCSSTFFTHFCSLLPTHTANFVYAHTHGDHSVNCVCRAMPTSSIMGAR